MSPYARASPAILSCRGNEVAPFKAGAQSRAATTRRRYSTMVLKSSGASSPVKRPPSMPPKDIQR